MPERQASQTRFGWVPSWITPNMLTILRGLFVIPVVLVAPIWPWKAVMLLVLSSACDYYDGQLARARQQTSRWGAVLDPLSDKIFILGTLWFACAGRVDPRFSWTITAIEAVLLLLRPVKDHLRIQTNANSWGKIKTWVQSFALAFVLTHNPFFTRLAPATLIAAIGFAAASLLSHLNDIRVHGKAARSS